MKELILLAAIVFWCADHAQAQTVIRNFGFEEIDSKEYTIGWDLTKKAGSAIRKTDATVAHSGKCSYLIAIADTVKEKIAAGASTVIYAPNLATKRMISVAVFIKTENLKDGVVLIGVEQFNSKDVALAKIGTREQSWTGTSDWRMQSCELKIHPDVKYIRIGFFMQGTGKAWFDDFKVLIDDQPLGNEIELK